MKKVLVIGAGAYQVPLIQRIKELGHKAYCVDGSSKAPGIAFADGYKIVDVCDKNVCLSYAQELQIDAVMTYGATITLPTVAYIGKIMGLPALDEKAAEISKSKYAIKQCLADGGLNTDGTFFCLKNKEDVKNSKFEFPCVIKPSDGSGSKGVSIVNAEEELEKAIDYAFGAARFGEIYTESFIPGEEYSVEAFCANGKAYVYAVVKTTFYTDASGVLHYGHRIPSGLSKKTQGLIEVEVLKAIEALGVNIGSVNFDVIVSEKDGKPYIIDVGIRVGQNLIASHMVPLSSGVSELDSAIHLALREPADIEPKFNKCVATRLLIYNPGTITEIKDFREIIGKNGVVDVVLRKCVGDVLRPYQEKSDSCGWVIVVGDTPDEVEANADAAREALRDYIIIAS